MRHIPLGSTDTMITDYCLGTMTWGNQTSENEAHIQMDMALDAGINIVDTAEMYPVNPVAAETVGNTEIVIGNWNAKHPSRRQAYVLATKISGKNDRFVRLGQPITGETFTAAVENSLRRLQTDYLDIFQLHWPNRGSYHFRQNWGFDPSAQDKEQTLAHMRDVLEAADKAVKAGKIRHFSLSNDSAWGTSQWLRIAEDTGLPRVQTVQNEYSLLCRLYDTDMAELAVNEKVTLLGYSPLATGLLTGKYQGGAIPAGSRMEGNGNLGGRKTDRAFIAVAAYEQVARDHGLDLAQMALAFTVQRPFPNSTIFGATTAEQLQHIINGLDIVLDENVMAAINAVHFAHPMPY